MVTSFLEGKFREVGRGNYIEALVNHGKKLNFTPNVKEIKE
jgi:hypothetical protein